MKKTLLAVLLCALCAQARAQTVARPTTGAPAPGVMGAGPALLKGTKEDLAKELQRLSNLRQAIQQMLDVTPDDPYLRNELRETEQRGRQVGERLEQLRRAELGSEYDRLSRLEQAIQQMLDVTPDEPNLRKELKDTELRRRQVGAELTNIRKIELSSELQRLSSLRQAIEQRLSVTPDDPYLRAELEQTEARARRAQEQLDSLRQIE